MTNLTPRTTTRTHPDQAGMTRNDTHQNWHNRDKSGQIWTDPDGLSQNSQSRAPKLSKTTRILRPTLTPPASATAPRTSDRSDPWPGRCRATAAGRRRLSSESRRRPSARGRRRPSPARARPPWSGSSGLRTTRCSRRPASAPVPISRNTSSGRVRYCTDTAIVTTSNSSSPKGQHRVGVQVMHDPLGQLRILGQLLGVHAQPCDPLRLEVVRVVRHPRRHQVEQPTPLRQ